MGGRLTGDDFETLDHPTDDGYDFVNLRYFRVSWGGHRNLFVILTGKPASEWLPQGSKGDVALVKKIRASVMAKSDFTDDDVRDYFYVRDDAPFEERTQILFALRGRLLAFLDNCVASGGIYHG